MAPSALPVPSPHLCPCISSRERSPCLQRWQQAFSQHLLVRSRLLARVGGVSGEQSAEPKRKDSMQRAWSTGSARHWSLFSMCETPCRRCPSVKSRIGSRSEGTYWAVGSGRLCLTLLKCSVHLYLYHQRSGRQKALHKALGQWISRVLALGSDTTHLARYDRCVAGGDARVTVQESMHARKR